MGAIDVTVLCLAWILGLLLTAVPGEVGGIPFTAIGLMGAGGASWFLLPRWRSRRGCGAILGCKAWVWLAAGIVGAVAIGYFQLRMPQPGADDVSRLVMDTGATPAKVFTIQGQIGSSPRLARSQRIQFWLDTTQAQEAVPPAQTGAKPQGTEPQKPLAQAVSGKLYVTVPLLQGTGLYEGQTAIVTGSLYRPKPATNPGGFDFQAYLARSGGFAGLSGQQVVLSEMRQTPLLTAVRQRMVRSQVQALGVPEGPLVSAMVMGRNGVDIPYDLQDQFSRIGLAHTLAASGFQVSLLVGVVLTLSRKLAGKIRFGLGAAMICAYIGLTGIQPSVLRAGIMGLAVLFAVTTERKVKPLGSLLLAATLLLIFNPLWIWDLGFQFSFLATLGLLVTVPLLMKWLDWLPTTIAPLVAVPIAAYLWTLPLQLYVFGVVSPYSIPINILSAPLVTVLSIGGMASATVALVYPPAGSALTWLLYYPTHGLIEAIEFVNQLPGNQVALGTISPIQTIAIYELFALVWWQSYWQRYWTIAFALGISLTAIPAWYDAANLTQVTVLATSGEPAIVIQDKGQVALVNSVSEEDANFTLLPFLKQQGVNQIAGAIATKSKPAALEGWYQVFKNLSIKTLYGDADFGQAAARSLGESQVQISLLTQKPVAIGSTSGKLVSTNPLVLQLQIQNQRWLVLENLGTDDQQRLVNARLLPQSEVLWWSGQRLMPQIVEMIKPGVAIAAAQVSPETAAQLQKQAAIVYSTDRDGAIQWTPQRGFTAKLKLARDFI